MIVDAASVDWAYVEGAYVDPFRLSESVVLEDGLALCFTKGMLALRSIWVDPEMLRFDSESKCPDFFSLREV